MNKLLFISITAIGSLFCSCNSYLDKPIYEPLTAEEFKKALEKDATFAYMYIHIKEPAKALNENTLLKAKFLDLTYRKMVKAMKYLNSDSYKKIYNSFENDWINYVTTYQPQVDSVVGYWKNYIEEMNLLAKIEPVKIRKEYYSYGDLKSAALGFRITSLKEQLKYISFRFSILSKPGKKKNNSLDLFSSRCSAFVDSPSSVEYADVDYPKRDVLENYDIKTFLEEYNVIIKVQSAETVNKKYDLYEVPSCVRHYLKDDEADKGIENIWFGDIIRGHIDKDFIEKYNFIEQKQAEFLSEKYPLYLAFEQFRKNYYENLYDKK